MRFEGFPAEQHDFFAAVGADTRWEVVEPRAAQHEHAIRLPLERLTAELAAEFGPAKVYRLHKARQYWVEAWAYIEVVDTIAYGVALSADGLWVEGGWLRSCSEQVARYRASVNSSLEHIVADLASHGFTVFGERLKRAPSPLLAHRSLVAGRALGTGAWLQTHEPVERVRHAWRLLRPLVEWLVEHVGPRPGRE